MAHGRQRHDLSQTAEILAMVANAAGVRSKSRRRAWSANDFLPKSMQSSPQEPSPMKGHITDLKIFLPPNSRKTS